MKKVELQKCVRNRLVDVLEIIGFSGGYLYDIRVKKFLKLKRYTS
jgi:hypothetical protein